MYLFASHPPPSALLAPPSLPWHARALVLVEDVGVALIVLGIGCCVYRLVRGPHLADRAMAVDLIAVQLIGLVVLFSLRLDTLVLLDGALVLSLIGFAGTVAMGQFILRRKSP